MIRLTIWRYYFGNKSTMGMLMFNGVFECYVLELPKTYSGVENVREKTCIPAGNYMGQVVKTPKHPDGAPHILNVPGRDAIEIHIANVPQDIKGCAAVGESAAPFSDFVGNSAVAFQKLMRKLPKGELFLVSVMDVLPTAQPLSNEAHA